MKSVTSLLSRYSKFIAATLGAVTEAVNIGAVPHQAQNYVSVAVSILTALGVAGVTNGPSPDVVGLGNDVKAIKDILGPLPKTGGIGGIVKWLADQAEAHGKNIEAIGQNAEEHLRAVIQELHGKPVIAVGSASPNQPQAGQDGTLKPVTEPVPGDVPQDIPQTSPVTVPPDVPVDHIARLAAMQANP